MNLSIEKNENNVITGLFLLDALLNNKKLLHECSLNDTVVICAHHALKTLDNLLIALFYLGMRPENTFILTKFYSDYQPIITRIKNYGIYYQEHLVSSKLGEFEELFLSETRLLWEEVVKRLDKQHSIRNILIIDHGGYANSTIPIKLLYKFKVIGLEKTTGGIINFAQQKRSFLFPIINVAGCAAKKFLESALIADAVVNKLSPVIPVATKTTNCGIVGYGTIGKALSNKLLNLGHNVIIYDNDYRKIIKLNAVSNSKCAFSLNDLINHSDLIFGCSGQDITLSVKSLNIFQQNKTFISCSSGDREFLTLLQLIQQKNINSSLINPLDDVFYKNIQGAEIKILRGGFPYNFDCSGESVPANEIQLTRALALSGVIQAIKILKNSNYNLKEKNFLTLDADLQKFIAEKWLTTQYQNKYSLNLIKNFQSIKWIIENSSGK